MPRHTFTEADEGKIVVNASGDTIGMVSGISRGKAHVDPHPELTGKIKARLGWDTIDTGDYVLDGSKVDIVTDDEIRLQRDP